MACWTRAFSGKTRTFPVAGAHHRSREDHTRGMPFRLMSSAIEKHVWLHSSPLGDRRIAYLAWPRRSSPKNRDAGNPGHSLMIAGFSRFEPRKPQFENYDIGIRGKNSGHCRRRDSRSHVAGRRVRTRTECPKGRG